MLLAVRARRASRSAADGKATGAPAGAAADAVAAALLAALPSRAARSAAAAAMIRAFRLAGGSTIGHALGQGRQHAAELRDLVVPFGARGEVGADGGLVARLERAEDEGAGHLEDLVVGQIAHRRRSAHDAPSSRLRRMASRPRRIRLLTVPSGVAVRSAISCWVNPPK